jgi:hypothetical protein
MPGRSGLVLYGSTHCSFHLMPSPPPPSFDFASALAKLRQGGLGELLSTFGVGQDPSSAPPPTQPPEAPWRPPGSPDFLGRLPFQPGYTGSSGQPSGEDGLITLHAGPGYRPPDMIQGEDGLLVSNPMAKAFKARKAAGEEAQRQGQSEETDALIEELGKAKARKDAAWDQELAQRSAYDAQRSEAEFQALASQRTTKKTPSRGGYLRIGRGGRGPRG